jgi:hypothetical protein
MEGVRDGLAQSRPMNISVFIHAFAFSVTSNIGVVIERRKK